MPTNDTEATVATAAMTDVSTDGTAASADGFLTLKEIAAALGVGYARIRGFADAAGMKEAMEARHVTGYMGVRYPPSAREKFAYLISAQAEGLVTPKTAVAWLANIKTETILPPASPASTSNGLISHSDGVEGPIVPAGAYQALVAALGQYAETIRLASVPQVPDTWYTLAAATKATGLSQRTIKANVPFVLDGTRKKYSGRDLAAFQANATRFRNQPALLSSDGAAASDETD